ncbi:DNA-directed RNA polymerase I and III 16 kDa polypeptide [Zopfochytrium polystomum]|nr:DNA-directed RNA polymerase I and III 16 kDa polypeptide [Zopfochytrium polystomum]
MAMIEQREGPQGVPDLTSDIKIEILKGEVEDPCAVTYILNDEDHTLGNSLRYMLMKNPDVSFCGYSVPHPSEYKIHLRIQTNGNVLAIDALDEALGQLMEVCNHVTATFTEALERKDYAIEADADIDTQIKRVAPPPKLFEF